MSIETFELANERVALMLRLVTARLLGRRTNGEVSNLPCVSRNQG